MKVKNTNKIRIIVLLLLFLISISVLLCINHPTSLKVLDLEIKFSVGDEIGITANQTNLDYGILYPGMSSTKIVKIENNFDFDIVVNVFIAENVEKYIFGENRIIVLAGQVFEYPVKLNIPSELEYGQYSGKIKFEIYKKE